MTDEIWRPVPVDGYEQAYSVSSHGRVRGEERKISHVHHGGNVHTRVIKGRVMRPRRSGQVNLCVGNVRRTVTIALMMQDAFGRKCIR